jgi:hypothetical protein
MKGYAHHASYEAYIGPIPRGLHVCHHCDNPLCINPTHLWIGSHKENMRDKMKKGRHNTSPLTEGDVVAIRSLYRDGERQSSLAKKFHVHQTTVSNIVRRRTWGHIS